MPSDIKDTIKDKINKLTAAMYLVTNFLDDSDQIKWKLRDKSLSLKDRLTFDIKDTPTPNVWPVETILSDINEIISLIDVAVLDRRASAMNFSILRQGYVTLQTEFQNYFTGDWYKNTIIGHLEVRLPSGSRTSVRPDDNTRQDKIIDFIKQHNWSSIREIAQSIPNISGKTVQRELAELVRLGKLKKTGERRWSRYNLD